MEEPITITTSKEYVAHELAREVRAMETSSKSQEINEDFRKYYLDLYAECLDTAKDRRVYK